MLKCMPNNMDTLLRLAIYKTASTLGLPCMKEYEKHEGILISVIILLCLEINFRGL